ncbi:MAG TPA: hypothetical protein VF280_04920 [Burkholderiales bacterium]
MKRALGLALLLVCAGSSAQQYQFNVPRELHCSARPYCGTPGRTCKGVEKTYRGAAAGSARNSIIQECVQANRPDRCNCIQQCRQVAQCSRN